MTPTERRILYRLLFRKCEVCGSCLSYLVWAVLFVAMIVAFVWAAIANWK
jgi:hypothetical protein